MAKKRKTVGSVEWATDFIRATYELAGIYRLEGKDAHGFPDSSIFNCAFCKTANFYSKSITHSSRCKCCPWVLFLGRQCIEEPHFTEDALLKRYERLRFFAIELKIIIAKGGIEKDELEKANTIPTKNEGPPY